MNDAFAVPRQAYSKHTQQKHCWVTILGEFISLHHCFSDRENAIGSAGFMQQFENDAASEDISLPSEHVYDLAMPPTDASTHSQTDTATYHRPGGLDRLLGVGIVKSGSVCLIMRCVSAGKHLPLVLIEINADRKLLSEKNADRYKKHGTSLIYIASVRNVPGSLIKHV